MGPLEEDPGAMTDPAVAEVNPLSESIGGYFSIFLKEKKFVS